LRADDPARSQRFGRRSGLRIGSDGGLCCDGGRQRGCKNGGDPCSTSWGCAGARWWRGRRARRRQSRCGRSRRCRGGNGGCNRLGLALRVGNRDQIGGVVDDDRVVDVVVDDVAWRRLDLRRRRHPHRHRPILGDRQHESNHGRWRRWQIDEVNRRRRKENDRRRRRWLKAELGIGKHQDRPIHIDDFIRRRRRQAVVNDREDGRWLQCGGKIRQTPSRIVGMCAARIASQI
jgi:hypothetical protein